MHPKLQQFSLQKNLLYVSSNNFKHTINKNYVVACGGVEAKAASILFFQMVSSRLVHWYASFSFISSNDCGNDMDSFLLLLLLRLAGSFSVVGTEMVAA